MKRVEIIITQAIESDFTEYFEKACKVADCKCKLTKIENVMGQGNTTPKMGDPIWPQLNVMFIIYCEDKMVKEIKEIMETLHKQYVGEGAAAFVMDADEV